MNPRSSLLACVLLACGPYAPPVSHPEITSAPLPPPPPETSAKPTIQRHEDAGMDGARLKARYSTMTAIGADGSTHVTQRFVGWFDTQRQESCKPMRAEDGKMRCLPEYAELTAAYYVDAKCAKPVVPLASEAGSCDGPTTVPKYFAMAVAAASCSLTTIAPLGPRVDAVSWYKKEGNACKPLGRAPATLDFYDASAEPLDPKSFVEMSVEQTTTIAP